MKFKETHFCEGCSKRIDYPPIHPWEYGLSIINEEKKRHDYYCMNCATTCISLAVKHNLFIPPSLCEYCGQRKP
jgi:hypothetical protein